MVLRFTCPCGAPYALADHLAGRTFQCTQCNRSLKIGAPAPPRPAQGAPARDPNALMASMEWGAQATPQQQAGPPARPAPGRRQPPQQKKPEVESYELAPDPDEEPEEGLWNSLEDEEAPPPPKGRKGARSSGRHTVDKVRDRAKRRTSSRTGRQGSGVGRKSSSRTGRQGSGVGRRASSRSGRVRDPEELSRACPVCEATIARVAVECPNCGVSLRGPSAADQLKETVLPILKPVVGLAALAGIVFYVYTTVTKDKKPPGRRKGKVAVATPNSDDDGGAKTTAAKTSPDKTGQKTGDGEKTGAPAKKTSKTEPQAKTTEKTEKTARRPKDPQDPPPRKNGEAGISRGGSQVQAIVPDGPLEQDFKKLRDAKGFAETQQAIKALAGKQDLLKYLKRAMTSEDEVYLLRLHRVNLRRGDAERRKQAILASLKKDANLYLLYTVLVALELDGDGLREELLKIPYRSRSAPARALADAVLDGSKPSSNLIDPLRSALKDAKGTAKALTAILLAMAGDGVNILAGVECLNHPLAVVQKLGRAGLKRVSAGSGPAADAGVGEWRTWARAYQPLRTLLAKACADLPSNVEGKPTIGEISAAKRKLIEKGGAVLGAIATFMHDLRSRTPTAAQALGDIIARTAGPDSVEQLTAILNAIDSGRSSQTTVPILVGCLTAGDAKVAKPAVEAMMRTSAPISDHLKLPDLQRPPAESDLKPLVEYVRALGTKRAWKGWSLLAAFRSKAAESVVLGKGDEAGEAQHRRLIAARLGSPKVERALRKMAEGGAATAGLADPERAATLLGRTGTSAAVAALVKMLLAKPTVDRARAFGFIAAPNDLRKVRKLVESTEDPSVGATLFKVFRDVGGKTAGAALGRRFKRKDDPLRTILTQHVLALGAPGARAEVIKVFEDWKKRKFKQPHPGIERVRQLARCGKPADGVFLNSLIAESKLSLWDGRQVLFAMGEIGYKQGAGMLVGYIVRDHNMRDIASVTLALLGATDAVKDMEAISREKRTTQRATPEDTTVVASMAFLDAKQGGKLAAQFVPALIPRDDPTAVVGIAYALALAGDQKALRELGSTPRAGIRAATAMGIGWAALAVDEPFTTPEVLEDLRVDPVPKVRAEAAVARAYLKLEGAAQDLGNSLVFVGTEDLDYKRIGDTNMARLASTSTLQTLRQAIWHAFSVVSKKGFPYREGFSEGRRRELERLMRKR